MKAWWGGYPAQFSQQCLNIPCEQGGSAGTGTEAARKSRLQKEEQSHAKTISLSFQWPYPTSSPPSTCIQRRTVLSPSFLPCPAGPSCAPDSHPRQPRSGLGPLHHPRGGSQDLSTGRVGGMQERATPGCSKLTAAWTAKAFCSFRHLLLWD